MDVNSTTKPNLPPKKDLGNDWDPICKAATTCWSIVILLFRCAGISRRALLNTKPPKVHTKLPLWGLCACSCFFKLAHLSSLLTDNPSKQTSLQPTYQVSQTFLSNVSDIYQIFPDFQACFLLQEYHLGWYAHQMFHNTNFGCLFVRGLQWKPTNCVLVIFCTKWLRSRSLEADCRLERKCLHVMNLLLLLLPKIQN